MYRDDDMTYAVIRYAEYYPSGKMAWKDISEWVNMEENQKADPVLRRLRGIHDYQFYRPVKRNGKKTYRECKQRFDEICEMRQFISETNLPTLVTMNLGQFLALESSRQMKALVDMQDTYKEVLKRLGIAEAQAADKKTTEKYIKDISRRIEDLEERIDKTIRKSEQQIRYMMRKINETAVGLEVEKYGITAEGINRARIMDILEKEHDTIGSIKRDLEAYRRFKKEEEGETAAEPEKREEKKTESWKVFSAALFEDNEENDDTE